MRETTRRWRASAIAASAGALVVTAALVAAAALIPRASSPQAGDGVTRVCATHDDLAQLAAALDAVDPVAVATDGRDDDGLVAAFLGDSYTVGVGTSMPERRWSTLVAEAFGWQEVNAGASGTGYAATYALPGAELSESYAARVADIVAAEPDVVVVSGGRNDLRCDLATIAEGAQLVLSSLRVLLPEATIVVVDPWWGTTDVPAGLGEIAGAVAQAASTAGVPMLDTEQPLGGTDHMAPDGVHPDDAGHAVLAEAVVAALTSTGVGAPSL